MTWCFGYGPKIWLRLGSHPVKADGVWMSGLMGALEHAPLPSAWRNGIHMAYPFDLPDKRRIRVDYPLGWFRIRKVPILDLQVQADTYLACGLLSENAEPHGGYLCT